MQLGVHGKRAAALGWLSRDGEANELPVGGERAMGEGRSPVVGVDVPQQRLLLGELLVAVRAEDRLQLQVNRAQVPVQVACGVRT